MAARADVLAPCQGLVHLDGAAELVLPGSAHRRLEAVQHRLGGLIGAQSEQLLHLQRRDTVFGAGHVPGGGESHGERGPGVVADDSPTVRAAEPFRPTQPVEVVQTRITVRKPGTQRRVGTRVVKALGRHSEILRPGQSNGYPILGKIHPATTKTAPTCTNSTYGRTSREGPTRIRSCLAASTRHARPGSGVVA